MKLPVLFTELKPQQWDCHGCTNCCRELVVHLTQRDVREIDRQNWSGKLPAEPYVSLRRETVLNHGPDGACVFLTDQGRCRIHEEHGEAAKPLACQLYPFSLNREGDKLRSTIRFDCPSTAASKGSPLSAHRTDVARIAGQLDEAGRLMFAEGGGPPRLTANREMSIEENSTLVDRIDQWLRDMNRPMRDRLNGLSLIVEMLERAKLEKIRDERFAELLDLFLSDLPEVIKETPAPPPPTSSQMKLLRMNVFAHCEYIPFEQARKSFFAGVRYRWDQLRRSRQLAGGTGPAPKLISGCGATALEGVDRVTLDPSARSSSDELITRYVRMRILGGTAFGSGYYRWPAVDGLNALLVAICTADWVARFLAAAAGRDCCTVEDLRRAVGVVDRTAGRARELGARTASLRIRYLAQDGGVRGLLRNCTVLGEENRLGE